MIEPVGTTIAGLGLLALISVALDCLDRVQDGMSLGKDFVLLEGQFSNYRIRLFAWAKACGFFNESGYDRRLDNPTWTHHVQKQLSSVCLLFMDAKKIIKKYEVKERSSNDHQISCANAQFVNDAMTDFIKRISETKSNNGFFGGLSWAVKYKKKFKELLENLEKSIEGLEFVARNLDLFESERQIVDEEVHTISDTHTLENLVIVRPDEVEESDVVSDAATQRLRLLREGSSKHRADDETFFTAPTHRDGEQHGHRSVSLGIRGASDAENYSSSTSTSQQVQSDLAPITRIDPEALLMADSAVTNVPQHQRVMQEVSRQPAKEKAKWALELDEEGWGKCLVKFQQADLEAPLRIPSRARASAKRIRNELLAIQKLLTAFLASDLPRTATKYVPISARSIGWDETNINVRATIAGPPQSPYKDGIFHLSYQFNIEHPFKPPLVQFLTRIYHPNIDHEGKICTDILADSWAPWLVLSQILYSILSIMSDPTCDDPLVPEIAATYVQDRDLYDENARLYTQNYATDKQSYPAWEVFPLSDS
jgi:ubiquitin-conjugating enzyme E2 D/E